MSFQEHTIKTEYRSLIDNVVQKFYVPLLKEAVSYKRAVGFFSSSSLIEISKGIADLASRGGRIQIVASPYLSDDDIEAIKDAVKSFVFDVCKAEANWNMKNFIADQVEIIRRQVGDKKVLLALSGGVDSSVVAALLIKAIGKQLVCVHVNHGLMRKNESESVVELFRNKLNANLIYVDATDRFLGKLENVADPEQKRKERITPFR